MGDSKLFDAAKKTTEIVAAKASEVTQSVAGDTIRDMAAGVKEQLADVTTDIKEMSAAKLDEALADFNAALPLLRDAGYVLDGVSVKLGLAPQIVANFAGAGVLSEERVDAMLAEHSGRKLTTLLVKAVRHATTLQSKLTISGMRADGLSVEVGLVPQVTVKFTPTSRSATEEPSPSNAPVGLPKE